MFKVGDKVIRKERYIKGFWTSNGHSNKPEIVKEVIPEGGEEVIKVEGDQNQWYSKYFYLYFGPAQTWTPKYAVGDKVMPSKAMSWLRPVTIKSVKCKFIYETGESHFDNVPEEKVQAFIQKPREIIQDGVKYREVL